MEEYLQFIPLVLGMLAAMIVLIGVANKVQIPYPILLVLGGLAIGFVPGLPTVPELEPGLVFLIFLPPLLMYAAYFTSIRDFRFNLRPITLLAVGLVVFTTVGVAVVAHAIIPGIGWPAAFALGAIVAPPDAVAATSITQRLGVPRRIVTVLEGESLLNDATALVALRIATAAAGTAAATGGDGHGGAVVSLSFGSVTWEFLLAAGGGIAIGIAIGLVALQTFRFVTETTISITVSFLACYGAYTLSELLHVSGVLGVVTLGLILGRWGERQQSSLWRLEGRAVWNMVVFLLNGIVFILIGLQLRRIVETPGLRDNLPTYLGYAAVISLAVIALRIVWVFPATYLWRFVAGAATRARDPYPNWRSPAIVSWAGMRGVVSLAAALTLPIGFPERDPIIFVTFCVIFATLVLQGLSLAPLVRALGVCDGGEVEREETKARYAAAHAGIERLETLRAESWVADEMAEDLGLHYEARTRRYGARHHGNEDGADEERAAAFERLQTELLEAEREAIYRLRDEGVIADEALRRVQRDIDLERVRLDGQ